jgi:hypothetical protein
MARVEIASQAWGVLIDQNGRPISSQAATLKNLDGTNATTWSALTGGTSSTSSLSTDATGTLPRYVEEGTYSLVVGATTRRVEAVRARVSAASYGLSEGASAAVNAAAITAALATGQSVLIPAGEYNVAEVTFPVSAFGGQGVYGEGATRTILNYTGTGFLFTFGDGGATDTRYQTIQDMRLVGNGSVTGGAVKFFHTRWCAVRRCDIRQFWNASANAVLIDSEDHNYHNELELIQFNGNQRDIKLAGHASGIGANSNHVFRCHFSLTAGASPSILIDGGDTNRIKDNDFEDASPLSIKVTGTALYNRLEGNQFDGPTKAWEIDSGAVDTHLLWNSGATEGAAIEASTDAGTRTVRRDYRTENAKCSLYISAGQSIANTSIDTLTWTAEQYDPIGMHSTVTNPERVIAPMAGLYRVTVRVRYLANATGVRMCRVTKNGTTNVIWEENTNPPSDGTSPSTLNLSFTVQLAAADYLIARCYQTSGGALSVEGAQAPGTIFQMERIG